MIGGTSDAPPALSVATNSEPPSTASGFTPCSKSTVAIERWPREIATPTSEALSSTSVGLAPLRSAATFARLPLDTAARRSETALETSGICLVGSRWNTRAARVAPSRAPRFHSCDFCAKHSAKSSFQLRDTLEFADDFETVRDSRAGLRDRTSLRHFGAVHWYCTLRPDTWAGQDVSLARSMS